MNTTSLLTAADLKRHSIRVHEPFSEFLHGTEEEKSFDITLLDVVRFAGHACPSMIGAFLIARKAVQVLFPEDGVCVRGDVVIDIPDAPNRGATGPMANVFSFITGSWGETGFGGLRGQFGRRNLLKFNSPHVSVEGYRFTRVSTGVSVEIQYTPADVPVSIDPSLPFQAQWRQRIKAILAAPDLCIKSRMTEGKRAL